MFFANFGITCTEYIRRRKLTLAAVELLNNDKNIIDIGLKYGYNSPNAFTRAFRNMHGINPSKARSQTVTLSSYNRVSFPIEHKVGEKMKYKIIESPEFTIIGRSQGFKFDSFVQDGPKFWKEYVGSKDYQRLNSLSDGGQDKIPKHH